LLSKYNQELAELLLSIGEKLVTRGVKNGRAQIQPFGDQTLGMLLLHYQEGPLPASVAVAALHGSRPRQESNSAAR